MRVFGSFFASLVSLFGFLSLALFYGFWRQVRFPFVLFSTSLVLLRFWFAVLQFFCPLGVFISFGVSFLHICPFSFSYFLLFVSQFVSCFSLQFTALFLLFCCSFAFM